MREQLNLALSRQYGATSEVIPDAQLRLFNEAETDTEQAEPPASIEVHSYTRQRTGRRPLPESLPRVDVLHDVPEDERVCPHDGQALERIGEDTSEQLDIVPAKLQVLRHIRAKYACPACEQHVMSASMPAQPIPKSMASPGLLAHVAVSKYTDALPLYRQERIFERMGVSLARASLANWMVKTGELLQPVINLMREELLTQGVIHADETTVQVLNEPGKSPESTSYMWVQAGCDPERPIVLFDYDPSRSGRVPMRLFGEYDGVLVTDGYEGYTAVCRANGIIQAGCWAHGRRRFDEVLKASGLNTRKAPKGKPPPKARRAAKALRWMKTLFAIEHAIREHGPQARYEARQARSRPVIDELRQWLDETLPTVPPNSALGRALGYLDSQWPRLVRYLDDGRIEMTNNRAENAIRPFVLGRKNWLFSATTAGAKASANLYSVIETAKACDLEPYAYLRHLLTHLPRADCVEDIEALLPYFADKNQLFDLDNGVVR
ncbi:MAG: IS66 family transposase [Pseudomonadota bacterium]